MSNSAKIEAGTAMERMAALAILAALVAGLLMATFGTAYSNFADQRAEAERTQRLLNRLEGLVERQGRLADYLAVGNDATRLNVIFLNAPQAGIGVARLQDQIGSLATNSGLSVRRVSAVNNGAANKISLQVQVTGNIVAFSGFLVGLESSVPWLFVDSMNVSQTRQRRRDRNGAAAVPELTALLTISAYTGPGDGPAAVQGGSK